MSTASTTDAAGPHAQLATVRVAADGVAEMDGNRPLLFVKRADVIRIEAEYGAGAERPIVMLVLGLLMLAIAIIPVILFLAMLRSNVHLPEKTFTAVAFILPAGWLLDLSLRKRWFLRVHTRRGSRKLLFPRGMEQTAVEAFVSDARTKFGY